MDRFDPFVKYADVYGDIINWEKDPMNKPQNQNKYFFSDGKTYYEQICKMLRLMSVFKEAFNQIYNNEDEISEAWENFVNNLSASVVEGNEPDVTLTWTDDSVNFEFTMVPGVPGDPGVGITSISFNSDYTMTITLSDGATYTSMSLKGDTGPQGPQGETGSGLQILDVYATLADLQSAHPTGQPGDAYQVGSGGSYTLYIWSSSQLAWIPAGSLGTVSPSTSSPLMDGTASAGSSDLYSRGDHVHPSDTSRASQEELDALIRTSQSLIDQSFTYRESPAIQDGLAKFDKIKGNTVAWNQMAKPLNSSNYGSVRATATYSNDVCTITTTSANTICGIYITSANFGAVIGHKYLFMCTVNPSITRTFRLGLDSITAIADELPVTANKDNLLSIVQTATVSDALVLYLRCNSVGDTATIKNVMAIDLTLLGMDDVTDKASFQKYFSLSYYSYNQGTLVNFSGNGIKTVGKNQLNAKDVGTGASGVTFTTNVGSFRQVYSGTSVYIDARFYASSPYANGHFLPTKYTLSFDVSGVPNGQRWTYGLRGTNNAFISGQSTTFGADGHYSLTVNFENVADCYISFCRTSGSAPFDITISNLQLEIGTSETSYKDYTTHTASLPILTYFPNGMRSAGSVRDELTPSKAVTRIGTATISGGITSKDSQDKLFLLPSVSGIKNVTYTDVPNITSRFEAENLTSARQSTTNAICQNGTSVYISLASENITTIVDANTYLASNPLVLNYELETPTETAVDLDLSFNAYVNGTEQLLPVNGPVPSTSPVIADMTYLSIDDAMEYIIEKLANVPQNTQQILESLEDDVADLQEDVGALQPAVSALQTSVGNINTNIGQLSSTVAGHTASISDMQSDITDLNTGLGDLEDTVTNNTSRIGTLETGLSDTNGDVQDLSTSVSDLDDTVTAQGTTVTALDNIISDISNNPVINALGSHELGFVLASAEVTLPANTGTMVTIPKPTIFPNNYTPLFIVGMSTGSYNVSICSIPNTFGTGNSVTCRVWNHGSQQTTQISLYILCMRQRQAQ